MKPSELEISLKVMHSINDANRMSDKQWLLSIERAQYEADRAERQFMLADPENRLVVRSWNPTGTRSSKNWNKQNRIMPYTIQKSLGPFRKRRTGHPESRTKDPENLECTNFYAERKETYRPHPDRRYHCPGRKTMS